MHLATGRPRDIIARVHHPLVPLLLVTSALSVVGCGPTRARPAQPALGTSSPPASALPPRPRPPLAARSCDHLTGDEERRASNYLQSITRIAPLYADDAFAKMQQRSIVGKPGAVVGVRLYVPAEYGMNRAYLEQLLVCHAVRPPQLSDHPNDPLLAIGIIAVEIKEAPGGEYEIAILTDTRRAAQEVVGRARALTQRPGSVHVEQVAEPDGPGAP